MNNGLSTAMLAELRASAGVLGIGRYMLPVRFRLRDGRLECAVPTWSGAGDMLEEPGEVTLVVIGKTDPPLHWMFVRGLASVVAAPIWDGLQSPADGRIRQEDLYQVIRIEPRRIERIDERRGWGVRETMDL